MGCLRRVCVCGGGVKVEGKPTSVVFIWLETFDLYVHHNLWANFRGVWCSLENSSVLTDLVLTYGQFCQFSLIKNIIIEKKMKVWNFVNQNAYVKTKWTRQFWDVELFIMPTPLGEWRHYVFAMSVGSVVCSCSVCRGVGVLGCVCNVSMSDDYDTWWGGESMGPARLEKSFS